MKCLVRRMLLVGAFCLNAGWAAAQDATPPSVPQRPIPFKTEPTPIEEQGTRTALVLVLLLLATGVGLYLVRKRMPRLVGLDVEGRRLRMVERIRLNPRTTLYLVQLDQREMLIAQCGDHLLQLDPARAAASPPVPSEANHA